jgi:hypothetical protein
MSERTIASYGVPRRLCTSAETAEKLHQIGAHRYRWPRGRLGQPVSGPEKAFPHSRGQPTADSTTTQQQSEAADAIDGDE